MQGMEVREGGCFGVHSPSLWLRARWLGELVLGWEWTVEHFGCHVEPDLPPLLVTRTEI